jgi:hypothetical protein
MEYTIVEGFEAAEVIALVNKHLKEGWELHGALIVATTARTEEGRSNNCLYAQAMTKKAPEQWADA